MKIQKNIKETTLEITVEGRLDTITAPVFEEEVKEFLDNIDEIIMDCKNLDYTTSAGLRVILEIQQIMEDKNGVFKLRNVNKDIFEILEFTGFLNFLVIE